MCRRDWNLVVLASARGEPLSPLQLQKSLFLLGRNLPASVIGDDFYNFEPYNYGPFDARVYSDAAKLAFDGLATRLESGRRWTEYAATPKGMDRARQLEATVPTSISDYVKSLVSWVRSQSFPSLVRTIYRLYPEMRVNSVFDD